MIRYKTEAAARESLSRGVPRRKQKYNAIATNVDGIRFPSKHEAETYKRLKAQQAAGHIAFFLRQTPMHLPGGTRLVVDFVVFTAEALKHVRFVDAKGMLTDVFKVKRREVEHHYGVRIETV